MRIIFNKRCKSCNVITFLVLFTLFSFISPTVAKSSTLYERARDSYYSLIKSSKKKKYRHNYENSINKFLKVTKSKRDPKADDAMFMIGELYKMLSKYSGLKKDLKKSIEYYEKVAAFYPKSTLADDSIYKAGEIYEDKLKDYTNAYNSYYRITKEYPKGDMISKARSKLIKLKRYAPKEKKKQKKPSLSNLILVKDIKYWSEDDSTRIVIYPNESIAYKYDYLKADKKNKKNPRIYIDLFNTKLNPKIKALVTIKDGLLKSIRSSQYDKDIVRIVLDIESIKSYRIFKFEDPFRIVIDVSGERYDEIARLQPDELDEFKPIDDLKEKKTEKKNYTLAKQLGLSVKKIVIDPGHGGRDPGAIGLNKTREKDVTLKISKKLKDIIEKNLDCEVLLTRDKDVTLQLEERTAIAKRAKADLFISIHTNASDNGRLHGIETYFLNYAIDEHAMATAARENATSKLAISDLEEIIKIIRYSNVQESSELANKVQKAIIKNIAGTYSNVKNLGVKQAPFYVLFGSQKPSILVETSFIDHKVEGKRLQDNNYVTKMAQSIFNGISDYIKGFDIASRN